LRKLGMRDAIDQILRHMAEVILQGKDPEALRQRYLEPAQGVPDPKAWAKTLQLLLHVSSGWFYFGQTERPRAVLAQVRALLFQQLLSGVDQTELAVAYVRTLGQAPVEMLVSRLEELFRRLGQVADNFTSATHYSRLRLDVVQEVVLALVGEDSVF